MSLFHSSANAILEEWRREFDVLSVVPLAFHSVHGDLYLNDLKVNVSGNLSLLSAQYEARKIVFYLDDSRKIQINIAWPAEKPPYVSAVSFVDARR